LEPFFIAFSLETLPPVSKFYLHLNLADISEYIHKKRLTEKTPAANVYTVPFFFKDYILSNDMCYILIRLLHQAPKHRYQDLKTVKQDLLDLRHNICQTPLMLRKLLGHPFLPGESF